MKKCVCFSYSINLYHQSLLNAINNIFWFVFYFFFDLLLKNMAKHQKSISGSQNYPPRAHRTLGMRRRNSYVSTSQMSSLLNKSIFTTKPTEQQPSVNVLYQTANKCNYILISAAQGSLCFSTRIHIFLCFCHFFLLFFCFFVSFL